MSPGTVHTIIDDLGALLLFTMILIVAAAVSYTHLTLPTNREV